MPIKRYDHLIFYCDCCFVIWPDTEAQGQPPVRQVEFGEVEECPSCGRERTAIYEESWMRGVCRWQHTELTPEIRHKLRIGGLSGENKGPKTPEGKLICSMNRRTHGVYAKQHYLPKARPGMYRDCTECPLAPKTIDTRFERIDVNPDGNGRCLDEKFLYCTRHSEVIMSLINAHNGGGPDAIKHLVGQAQGWSMVNLLSALNQIALEGPTIRTPIMRPDKDGRPVECGERLDAHPALTAVRELSAALKLGLPEWNLTPQSAGEAAQTDSITDSIQKLFQGFVPVPKQLPESTDGK